VGDFRPVRTEWGPNSASFIDPQALESFLSAIGEEIGSIVETGDVNEMREVYIEKGVAFLAFVMTDRLPEFAGEYFADDTRLRTEEDKADLTSLVGNIQSLTPVWAGFLDKHGELRFWIDQS
jgi:hypothetical protein